MSGNLTTNSSNLVRQQVYSDMVLLPIQDQLLADSMVTDLSEFSDGDTINVPLVGECEVHDYAENEDAKFDPMTTGRFTMTITNYKESAHYITDKMKQDGYKADLLMSRFALEERRAILEAYETSLLNIQASQTASDPNTINTAPHRFVAGGTNKELVIDDFANAAYAMDMANLPLEGRIAIVSPYTSKVLNTTQNIVNVSNNPNFQGLLTSGIMSDSMNLAREIFGIKVIVSKRLATVAAETISGVSVTNAKANLFMCVADSQTSPIARAWRQMPTVVTHRNDSKGRDEYITRARWGVGLIRVDGLVTVLGAVPSSGFSL